jgi:hypothetical protein
VEATRSRIAAERNALTLLSAVNPMAEPEGTRTLGGGLTLTWTAEPLTEKQVNAGVVVGNGLFEVQLFRLNATLRGPQLRDDQRIAVSRVGWRSLRTAETDNAF